MSIPQIVELTDADAVVHVAPWRGGMVTRFLVGDDDALFLDETTFADPTKNVRGGIPLLFPTPGKLSDDRWTWRGHSGVLGQHGFLRRGPWHVRALRANQVELGFDWAGQTDVWPWPCAVAMRYELAGRVLRLSVTVENRGDSVMPFGFGIHPYFRVTQADKAQLRVPTHAQRGYDNHGKRRVEIRGPIDLTAAEVDLHLEDHGSTSASLTWASGNRAVRVVCSPEFSRWVLWTQRDRAFVCLEPWTCPGDALNTGASLLELAPGAQRSLSIAIHLDLGAKLAR